MAQQLNLLGTGQIIPTALDREMKRSYLEYAMSVIVGRALPDVRDGLKPVHRRILYAMHELGLTPDKPYRKCARVVGDVLGKYHPHGDRAVYDALVRMVQDFASRYPLLSGHGNFGSVDDDPPAAMRYTETRLASIASEAMLSEIGEATVEFTDNFDNSQEEPVVLPAQLPILLLNGCSGIAVGMATNIPPHNLSEIVDGLIALIDQPNLSDEQLWQLIPGPDFPTGGKIIDREGVKQTYATGRGIITVRGIAKVEQFYGGKRRNKERTAIIITELPYQVNKASLIEKIADLVNQGRLEGIADLRDESDRQGMRIVVELKKDVNAKEVLSQLYQSTPLENNFGAIMLALVNNKPCQLSLRQILEEFLKFRERTLTKQYSYELGESQKRLHLLAGLLTALNNLDRVIEILRNAPDGSTAKLTFKSDLGISEIQADAILAMPMRRLTGLEKQKLETEYSDLERRINELEKLLSDRHELMKALKKELRSLKRKFADDRRTRIVNLDSLREKDKKSAIGQADARKKENKTDKQTKESNNTTETKKNSSADNGRGKRVRTSEKERGNSAPTLPLFVSDLSPTNDSVIEITHQGYIYWHNLETKAKSSSSIERGEDRVVDRFSLDARQQLIVITDSGKAYPIQVQDIPHIDRQKTLMSLLPQSAQREAKRAVTSFFLPEDQNNLDLVLLTTEGRIKRVAVSELSELTNRGLVLISLKEKDSLKYVCLTREGEEVAIATNGGRVLRMPITDEQLPIMGRSAQGNQVLRLRYGEQLVGCVTLTSSESLLLVSESGYGKRIPINALRSVNRGDLGTQAMQFSSKTDNLAGMILAKGEKTLLLTNQQRKMLVSIDAVPLLGKDGTGDRLAKLKAEEKIISITVER